MIQHDWLNHPPQVHEVIDDIRTPSATTSPVTRPDEEPAEEADKRGKKLKSKNTRIVTNVRTGGTTLNMSEDTSS